MLVSVRRSSRHTTMQLDPYGNLPGSDQQPSPLVRGLVTPPQYLPVASTIYDMPSCWTGPPALFKRRWQTDPSITSSSGTKLSRINGSRYTGMLPPGGGTLWYSSNLSFVICTIVTRVGVCGRSSASRYHPFSRIHAYFTRGGTDAIRASTSDPAVSARCL